MLLGSLLGSGVAKIGQQALSQVTSKIPAAATLSNAANLVKKVGGGIGPDLSQLSQFGSVFNTDGSTDVGEIVVTAPNRTKPAVTDMRVRLRAQDKQKSTVYGPASEDNILTILHDTDGLLFPYTPSISVSQDVDYKSIDLVHSNYDINTYTRTPSVSINVTGKFTVQNIQEGHYAIAVLHFLRTASKMYFGEEDSKNGKAGLPPPILLFSGYGTYMFNDLRCVLKSHSYSFDESVDMVDVPRSDGTKTRLPSLFTVAMTLGVQQTPTAMRKQFSLDKFRTGELMRKSGGWI